MWSGTRPARKRPHLLRGHRGPRTQRRVGDQPEAAGPVLTRHHRRLADGGVRDERGLDLARLDTEAPDLHLVVRTPQELEAAVLEVADEVARPVQARARLPGAGIRHEALRRQLRAAEIAARQPVATDVELTRDALRHGAPEPVQDVDPRVVDRAADRGIARILCVVHRSCGRHHRHFRRTVVVDHAEGALVRREGMEPVATREQPPQRRARLGPRLLQHRLRQRRGQEGHGDVLLDEPGAERGRRGARRLVRQVQARTGGQGGPDLPDRGIEGERGQQGGPVLRDERIGAPVPGDEVGEAAVRDLDSLRAARRPRGVDHVGQARRVERAGKAAPVVILDPGLFTIEADHARPEPGDAVPQVLAGQDHGRVRVPEHEGEAFRRVRRVEGYVGRPRLEDRDERHHQLRRALEADPHEHLGPDSEATEGAGQPTRPGLELAVGQSLGASRHGQRLRLQPGVGLDLLGHGAPQVRATRAVPVDQHPLSLPVGEKRKLGEGPPGPARQGREQGDQVLEHPLDRGLVEASAVVDDAQEQLAAGGHRDGERVVRALDRGRPPHDRTLARSSQVPGDRVVLEREQALEQGTVARHAAAAVGEHEGRVLVVPQLPQLALQSREPPEELRLLVHAHAYGQRVDEEAEHGFRALELRRPARRHRSVQHVALAAVAAQGERPRSLYDRVEREPLCARKGLQRFRRRPGEAPLRRAIGAFAAARPPRAREPQGRGRVEAAQRLAPEGLAARRVPALDPADVVLEWTRGAGQGRAGAAPRDVGREHLAQEQGRRPAVEQQVVEGEDQLERGTRPDRRHPQERGPREIEAASSVFVEERTEPVRLGVRREVAPVEVFPGQAHLAADELQGLLQALPGEGGAQHGVAVDHVLERVAQRACVRAFELEGLLHDVEAGPRLGQALEEDPLLHRAQRVGVLDRCFHRALNRSGPVASPLPAPPKPRRPSGRTRAGAGPTRSVPPGPRGSPPAAPRRSRPPAARRPRSRR